MLVSVEDYGAGMCGVYAIQLLLEVWEGEGFPRSLPTCKVFPIVRTIITTAFGTGFCQRFTRKLPRGLATYLLRNLGVLLMSALGMQNSNSHKDKSLYSTQRLFLID